MRSIPLSVEDALEKKCYLAALALALTIPDVYGTIEFPPAEPVPEQYWTCDSGVFKQHEYLRHEPVRKHYKRWFDKHVTWYRQLGKANGGMGRLKTLDGYMCYLLRCQILHTGSEDIGDKQAYHDVDFSFRMSSMSLEHTADVIGTMGDSNGDERYQLTIDPIFLSKQLADAAIKYEKELATNNDTIRLKQLEERRLNVVDLDKFQTFFRQSCDVHRTALKQSNNAVDVF